MWLEMALRSLLFTGFGVARGGSAMQYDIQTYVLMIMFRPNSAPCMKYLDRPMSGIRRRANQDNHVSTPWNPQVTIALWDEDSPSRKGSSRIGGHFCPSFSSFWSCLDLYCLNCGWS